MVVELDLELATVAIGSGIKVADAFTRSYSSFSLA
jgi:hypothetical protein